MTARLVSMRFLRALLDVAEDLGVDRRAALDVCKIQEDATKDESGWISVERMTHAWEAIPALSGDPAFGLHAAERQPLGIYGALELATMASATVGEAMTRMVRYYRSLGAMSDIRIVGAPDGSLRLVARRVVRAKTDLRHYFEHMFALLAVRVRMAAALRGAEVDLEVRFEHDAPSDVSEHARLFGPRVAFGAAANEAIVGAKTTALALRTANPELSTALEREAARQAMRPDAPLRDRVHAAIAQGLRDGRVSLPMVAKRLGLGPRTVQRSLKQEGTSYAEVLDAMRKEEALRALAAKEATPGELAYRLGFAQPSAFYRAFRRWTGASPVDFRD